MHRYVSDKKQKSGPTYPTLRPCTILSYKKALSTIYGTEGFLIVSVPSGLLLQWLQLFVYRKFPERFSLQWDSPPRTRGLLLPLVSSSG